jgi:uncharacterized protein (UPF0147 family)
MLCGCAHDALLREETQKFVEVAHRSETAGTAFYDGLVKKDREIWAFIHRVDPDCKPQPVGKSYSDATNDPLNFCKSRSSDPMELPLIMATRDKFSSRYAALEFISGYLEALAEVSQDPKIDASERFKSSAERLNLLLQTIREDNISDARIEAVASLANMLQQLSKDRESAKAIRRIAAENAEKIDADFRRLIVWLSHDEVMKTSQNDRLGGMLSQVSDSDSSAGMQARTMWIENRFYVIDLKQKFDECVRKASDEQIPGLELSKRDLCGKTAAGAMLAGWQAHQDFVSLIDGRLNAKQKARLMQLHRSNFFKVLKLYLDVTGVF